jgi:hypothetical protein
LGRFCPMSLRQRAAKRFSNSCAVIGGSFISSTGDERENRYFPSFFASFELFLSMTEGSL